MVVMLWQVAICMLYSCYLMFYGSWKLVFYHLISGPLLSYLTTSDMNEWAAVWCPYSIGLILLVIKTPIRKYLYVNSWYGLKIKEEE